MECDEPTIAIEKTVAQAIRCSSLRFQDASCLRVTSVQPSSIVTNMPSVQERSIVEIDGMPHPVTLSLTF